MCWIPNFWGWEEGQVAAVDVCERDGGGCSVNDCKLDSIWFQGCEDGETLMDWSSEGGKQKERSKSILLIPAKNVVCTLKVSDERWGLSLAAQACDAGKLNAADKGLVDFGKS